MTTGSKNISAASSSPETVLVVGATSSLAQALCRVLARTGYRLVLCGRDEAELELLSADIAARFQVHCGVQAADLLANDFSPDILLSRAGDIQHVVIAAGDMGASDPTDIPNLATVMRINYTVPAQIATRAAQQLAEKKSGTIVIISSVAGDRGRQSNYAYGSAKAALSTFTSGLRNRFFKQGVHVMTVKPGFVDTPMTWGMHSPLIARRDAVAEKIVAAMRKKKDAIYVPAFWALIMFIITHIPERIFKRLSL